MGPAFLVLSVICFGSFLSLRLLQLSKLTQSLSSTIRGHNKDTPQSVPGLWRTDVRGQCKLCLLCICHISFKAADGR
jgi:hypothetical protein